MMLPRSLLFFSFLFSHTLFAQIEVLGIGAPSMDYVVPVDDHLLTTFSLSKGGTKIMDWDAFTKVLAVSTTTKSPIIKTGDCVANTIKGLATLGVPCGMTGNIGRDTLGETFLSTFAKLGVKPYYTRTSTPTSQLVCLVSNDGERTFCIYNKAETEISEKDILPTYFENTKLVYLEGYHLAFGSVMEHAMRLGKESGATVAFDLCNTDYGEKYRERVWGLLRDYVDIVFVNEDESYALTHLPPRAACQFLHHFCEIAVVTMGDKGCYVASKEGLIESPAHPAKVVDTTGAGDLFATGFLYGYLNHESTKRCAAMGNIFASAVIEDYGAEITAKKWEEIRNQLSLSLSKDNRLNLNEPEAGDRFLSEGKCQERCRLCTSASSSI